MKPLYIILCSFFMMTFQSFAHDKIDIAKSLNNFHQAAADANTELYFDLLADNAIFLGTDATERWTKQSFKQFVAPYFLKGQGWLYVPSDRHITLLDDGVTAFFDEALHNKSYGQTRGSGVLVKTKQGWKIAQYNLSIPMPNVLAKTLVKQIKAHHEQAQTK